jgi:hypothetical protein
VCARTCSANKALVFHGTHEAVAHDVVIYGHRGAAVYIQNGAEYDNVLNHSVILCESRWELVRYLEEDGVGGYANVTRSERRCTCVECVRGQEDADNLEQAGVYLVSPNNKLLGNVISSMENAVFVNQAGSVMSGADVSRGKVCPTNQPIGETRGNTFKLNIGFGWYGNSLWPLQVGHTTEGFVTGWEQCHPFDLETGEDRHFNTIVEDHVECAALRHLLALPALLHHCKVPHLDRHLDRHPHALAPRRAHRYGANFGFGGYSLGDVTLRNYRTADQGGTYWKTYHRSASSGPMCDGCHFEDGLIAPGGDALVEYRDTTFGTGTVRVNHHCNLWEEATGGLCAPHFYVPNPIRSHEEGLHWVNEAMEGATDVLLTYNGKTRFLKPLGGSVEGAHAIFDDVECEDEVHQGSTWRACPEEWQLRTLKLYTLDRGELTVSSGGVSRAVPRRSRFSKWAGSLGYSVVGPRSSGLVHTPQGYSFVVRDGADVNIHVPTSLTAPSEWRDHFVMDLGHHGWATPEQNAHVRVTVTGDELLAGGPCWVHENASRAFITGFGGLISDAGEWVRCKKEMRTMWPLEHTQADYARGFHAAHPEKKQP